MGEEGERNTKKTMHSNTTTTGKGTHINCNNNLLTRGTGHCSTPGLLH